MIDNDNKAYLEAAKGWETDAILSERRQRRIAYMIAAVAVFVAVVAVVGISVMGPMKKVQTVLVKVDKVTGYTELADNLVGGTYSYDDAKDKYWVTQYVEARERYSNDITGNDYIKVGLLSDTDVGQRYADKMDINNKASPLNVYGKNGKVFVHVVSVTLLGQGIAQVRYTRTVRASGLEEPATNWIATVTFKYEDLKLTEADRRINLVGFEATDYRNEPEAVQTVKPVQ